MGKYREVQEELREPALKLRSMIQETWSAHAHLSQKALEDGALPRKIKELIALSIAVTRQCDGCIASHAKGAVRNGATEQEVAEALGVAILMNGGPGTVYGPRALEAFLEFKETYS